MNTQWIKTSDRAPTEADSPVWVYDSNVPNGAPLKGPMLLMCCPSAEAWSHWRPAKADIPEPPREETQRDKDEDAFGRWLNAVQCMPTPKGDVWHAACAYTRKDEREEVAKMLPKCGDQPTDDPDATERFWRKYDCACACAIEAIRARCEGRGQ
jgi:hypothetical protein